MRNGRKMSWIYKEDKTPSYTPSNRFTKKKAKTYKDYLKESMVKHTS